MGLSTEQIVKIHQLKSIARGRAFKICDAAKSDIIDTDNDLKDFVLECISNKVVTRLPDYLNSDFQTAFDKGKRIVEESDNNQIKILSYYDKDFPESLKYIEKKPIMLSVKGEYKQLNSMQGVAIIGTREPTDSGTKTGEFIGEKIGDAGFNVVSGLAKGCDSAAHRGCIKGNGITTAVLAHGLHTVYPKENKELAEDIVSKGGILLSEYLVGTGALNNYFVERDRLQAGLSIATIVIQTGFKGGTMHAVNATIKSNKVLAAIKYNTDLNSDKVAGNEMLIRDKGAFALKSSNLIEFIELLHQRKRDMTIISNNISLNVNESVLKKEMDLKQRSSGKKDKGKDNYTLNF